MAMVASSDAPSPLGVRSKLTPTEWARDSHIKVLEAREHAEKSRARLEGVLRREVQATETFKSRGHEVGSAFADKLVDTQALQERLRDTIRQVDEHILSLRKVDAELELAAVQKNERFAITEACMRKRTGRPLREKVRDEAECLLEEEYRLLERALAELAEARQLVQDKQRHLARLRSRLTLDLRDKEQALENDQLTAREYATCSVPVSPHPAAPLAPLRPASMHGGRPGHRLPA